MMHVNTVRKREGVVFLYLSCDKYSFRKCISFARGGRVLSCSKNLHHVSRETKYKGLL